MLNKEKIERQNDLITRAEEILNKAKEEKRELTDDEAQELAEIRDDVRKIKEFLKFDDDFRAMEKTQIKEDNTPTEEDVEVTEEEKMRAKEEHECRAFENFVRGRIIHEREGELTPAEGSGQAVIPTTIANRIIKKVYNICPILERSEQYNVKGKLDLPYYDTDTTNITVAYQEEFTPLTSSNGKFTSIQLDGFLAGALSKISRSLINNAQFNIVDFIVDEMAYSIKRFIENELLNGTEDKVEGLSTLENLVTSASATAITADELIDVQDSIKDEFQSNAIWVMSPKTRTACRKLKTTTGEYLLNKDFTNGFGYEMLGKPVYVSDNMKDLGAENIAIFYGDMKGLATKFSENINIEVLREKFADEHAVGVIGWFEFDAKVQDAQKLAGLKCHA